MKESSETRRYVSRILRWLEQMEKKSSKSCRLQFLKHKVFSRLDEYEKTHSVLNHAKLRERIDLILVDFYHSASDKVR